MPKIFILDKLKIERNTFKIELPIKKEILDFYIFCSEKNYFYWDKVKQNIPLNYSKEELWYTIKELRKLMYEKTPVKSTNGDYFVFKKIKKFDYILSKIDTFKSKKIKEGKKIRERFIFNNILGEAIASARIEGANIEEEEARKIVTKINIPQNRSEQMILNSYSAIEKIKSEYVNKDMSIDLLKEMYEDIAFKMDDYRIREENDRVNIAEDSQNIIYYKAPNSTFVQGELNRFIEFANANNDFHPIIKAIILYFWIGYLRPFTDGNERFARNIFYLSVFKSGYEIFSYLPLFDTINKSTKDYVMAFVYSDQDDFDLTYFADYVLDQIEQSFNLFFKNLEKERERIIKVKKFQEELGLNVRQLKLLQFFYLNPKEKTCISLHETKNQITRKTASQDLKMLAEKGYLAIKKQGPSIFYYPICENIQKAFSA